MKKFYGVLLLPLFLLVSCGGGPKEKLNRTEVMPTTITETEAKSVTTETTQKEVLVSDIKASEYQKILPLYFEKLNKYKSYKSVTKGKTSAQVLFINTDQSIEVTTIKGDYSYMINESHSSFVNTSHTVYFHDGKALFKDNDAKEYSLSPLNEYLKIYGVYPFENTIEGYLSGEGCILSIEKVESENDYKFEISFSPDLATNNVKIQMQKFGGLDDYPVFSEISLILTIKNDFTPVSIDLDSKYKAKKTIETSCHQQYTVTFSDFDAEIEIPNLSDVKSKFN